MFEPDRFMQRLKGPPLLMGVVNVTPDSFSDGGCYAEPETAAAGAAMLAAEGADIIDVGGESTRPGHTPLPLDEELARILPALDMMAARDLPPISIDTYKAETARQALAHGAVILNDVWGFQRDPGMAALAAKTGAPVICMHNRSAVDPDIDIVADVCGFLSRSLEIARRAGVREDRIILDPGFGFGKSFEQSLALLRGLDRVAALGFPLLVGVSRKGFIGQYSGEPVAEARLAGTLAANLLAAAAGHAAIIRVHDVRPHRQMLDFLQAYRTVQ